MARNMYERVCFAFLLIANSVCVENVRKIDSDKFVCGSSTYISRCGCGQETDTFTNIPLFTIDCSRLDFNTFPGTKVLPQLVGRFDLSHNEIKFLNETVLLCTENLRFLDVSYNKIQTISSSYFDKCTQLRYLNLEHNHLENIEPNLFDNVLELTTLNLQANNLISLPQGIFIHLKSLSDLILSNNALGEFLQNEKLVDYLPESALSLYVDNVNLKNITRQLFGDLHHLIKLSVTYNNVQDLPSLLLNNLEYLDISSTNISILVPGNMNFPNLKVLKLNRLPYLTNISEFTFYHTKILEELEIEHCIRLQNVDSLIFGFTNMKDKPNNFNLNRISLAYNALTTLNFSFHSIFGNLKEINLSGNLWDCDCRLKWIEDLDNILKDTCSIKCTTPENHAGKVITEIKVEDMNCLAQKDASTVNVPIRNWLFGLVGILTLIVIGLIGLLIYMGPYGDYIISGRRTLGPDSPYSQITIQPNRAEYSDEDINKKETSRY